MLAAGVFFSHQEREEQSSKLAQALGGRFRERETPEAGPYAIKNLCSSKR